MRNLDLFISQKIKLGDDAYSIFIKRDINHILASPKSKITYGIIMAALRKSNTKIFKDGINAIVVNSDKYTNTPNTILFEFYSKSKEIEIFKIANKYVATINIVSFQMVEDVNVVEHKNKLYTKRVKRNKKKEIADIEYQNRRKVGLIIVSKANKDNQCHV